MQQLLRVSGSSALTSRAVLLMDALAAGRASFQLAAIPGPSTGACACALVCVCMCVCMCVKWFDKRHVEFAHHLQSSHRSRNPDLRHAVLDQYAELDLR